MTVYPCDPRSDDKDVAWGKIKYHSVQQWFWTTLNNKEKMHVLNLPMIPCEKRLYPWFFTKASDDDSHCSGVSTTAWSHITHRSIRMLFSVFFSLSYLKRERETWLLLKAFVGPPHKLQKDFKDQLLAELF